MKIQIKLILIAILVAFGRLFAAFALAAQGKVGKSIGFNFLPALCVILLFSVLTACGGGGSGGGGGPAAVTPAPTPPSTMTVAMLGTGPYYRLAWDNITVGRVDSLTLPNSIHTATITVRAGQRYLRRYNGVVDATLGETVYMTPAGSPVATSVSPDYAAQIEVVSMRFFYTVGQFSNPPVKWGVTLEQTVYVAHFGEYLCNTVNFHIISGREVRPDGMNRPRAVRLTCLNELELSQTRTIQVWKTQQQILPVCWRDRNHTSLKCNVSSGTIGVALAFPDQTYRRDDGKCQSAPFYAVGNCQSENAVDVGNFAAFVSGLDGNGYRQFGIRHKWESDEWNAMAMVSHSKGLEFLDTWWGRLRFEHSIGHSVFDDATAFAEYESGITSLRQNGFMFADIPISGGRLGFRFKDFTASFGRPMHYKGKGNNAAAIHWKFDKESELSFRTHNNNTELQWQWRRRF